MTNPFRSRGERAPRSTAGEVGAWLFAFALALVLWLSVNLGQRESERTLRVRIDLANLPAGLTITNSVSSYAQVQVRGSGLLLSSIDADRMATQLDLVGVRPGRVTYSLSASDFDLPRNVEVTRVTPSRISLDIDTRGEREVGIRLVTSGDLAAGLEVTETIVLPAAVVVEGPDSQLSGVEDVETRPIGLGDLGAGVNEITTLLRKPGGKIRLRNPEVRVRFVIDRLLEERRFEDVPIEIRNSKGPWIVEPNVLAFVVRGTPGEVASLELSPGAVIVDATDQQPPGPGVLRPEIALPPGFDVVLVDPVQVTLRLDDEMADTLEGAEQPAGTLEAAESPE